MSKTAPVVDPSDETTAPLVDPEQGGQQEPSPEDLKRELREEKRAREAAEKLSAELKAKDEFWEKRLKAAERQPKTPQVTQKAEPPDPLDEFDWLKTLTEETDPARIRASIAKTVKAQIAAELKRGNYVSREEAEGYVAQMIEGATAMNSLVRDFPGLADPKSEFFQETQRQLAQLEADPSVKGTPQTALERMAAQQAEIVLLRAGKGSKAESEDERIARILAQKGLSGIRGAVSDGDDGLSADERRAIAGFRAAGFDIDEKSYREERKRANVGPRLQALRSA